MYILRGKPADFGQISAGGLNFGRGPSRSLVSGRHTLLILFTQGSGVENPIQARLLVY